MFIPLFLQLVYGVSPDELGPADAAADGRPARRRDPRRPRDQPDRPLQAVPDRGHRGHHRSACSCSRGWRSTRRRGSRRSTCWSSASASASSCRCSCSPSRTARRRRTSAWRRAPRRSSARWAARSASRCSARSSRRAWRDELAQFPPEIASRFSGGLNISPDEVHGLPAEAQQDFLSAFVAALSPVFLVGAVLTAIAFALAWFLREVPLRGAAGPPRRARRRGSDRRRHRRRGDHRARIVAATFRFVDPR